MFTGVKWLNGYKNILWLMAFALFRVRSHALQLYARALVTSFATRGRRDSACTSCLGSVASIHYALPVCSSFGTTRDSCVCVVFLFVFLPPAELFYWINHSLRLFCESELCGRNKHVFPRIYLRLKARTNIMWRVQGFVGRGEKCHSSLWRKNTLFSFRCNFFSLVILLLRIFSSLLL